MSTPPNTIVCKCGCGQARRLSRREVREGTGSYFSRRCASRHRAAIKAKAEGREPPRYRVVHEPVPPPKIGAGGLGACKCGLPPQLSTIENRVDGRKRFVIGCTDVECLGYRAAEGLTFEAARQHWNKSNGNAKGHTDD